MLLFSHKFNNKNTTCISVLHLSLRHYDHVTITTVIRFITTEGINIFSSLLHFRVSLFSVVQSAPHQCMNSGHVVIPSSPGYLSSTVTHETQCGSPDTPYLIRLNKGQQLNVTLIDFNTTLPTGRGSRGNALSSHGMIRGNPGNRHHSGSACQRYTKDLSSALY